MTDRPSPEARVIARLVPALSDRTCQQLRALLADDLATSGALAPANQSLIGVAALVAAHGRVPSIADYEGARADHPDWPHHNAVCRLYGSWLNAVSASVKLISHTPQRARPAPNGPASNPTRRDCVQGILRCRLAIGDWPGIGEYARWRNIEADLCRRTGTLDRVSPDASVIRRRHGTWGAALDLARHWKQPRPSSTTDPTEA